jgi:hypothetical protein
VGFTAVKHQTFCPYKGCAATTTSATHASRHGRISEAYPEVGRISDLVSFEPEIVSVAIDGTQLRLEPGQTVISHGPDHDLTVAEALPRK